jgi:hypothetical protein
MDTIDFNKHDIDIFMNETWQKYAGNIGRLFKITRRLTNEKVKSTSTSDFSNKNADIGKVMQSGTVKREMLTEATFNQTNF